MIRTKLSLDGVWDFFPDSAQNLQPYTLGMHEQRPRRIRVPGPWQAQFEDLRDYSGVAWYRRTFELPEPARDERGSLQPTYWLHFGAVDYHSTIWLNGRLVGEHEGGYLPFELKLDDMLRRHGQNELIVKVIDPGDDAKLYSQFAFTEIPHGKQSWYGPIGGIWQSVYLEVRHATHLRRLHVTPEVDEERALVSVALNQPARRELIISFELTHPQGRVTRHTARLAAGDERIETSLPVPSPLLWETQNPHLYDLSASLHEGGEESPALDTITTRFGMRTISTSADGHLMLNGRILYLRGALDQDYYPEMIYTPFSDEKLEEQFARAKHMGLNLLRTHIKITDPRYYDAADRAGLLIWTELPNWENLTPAVKQRARETLTGMVERDWNHPSIIIWTIVNEGWGVDLSANADHRAWLAETYDYLKQLDPHRLVVGNSACFTNFHVVTDIEDFHNYYSVPDHYKQWRDWVGSFAARPSWSYAHAYVDINAWREFLGDPWRAREHRPAPEVRRRGSEPMVVSEFGNWGLPDVGKLRRCYGGEEPWWFETGIEWGDGAVYPHGVEQRFKTWHLDRVFPTYSELAAASQRMQYAALKYQIEQMRRHPSIVGYVITEFTDVHWECNGLLDMCRNPKAFYDVIAAINGADAIVPDWERVAYWEGERCEVPLTLSHFSEADLSEARIEWYLDTRPEIRGVFEGIVSRQARITEVGTISFEVPQVAESQRARVIFSLTGAGHEHVVSNHLELYFFSRRAGAALAAPIFVSPALRERLAGLGYQLTERLEEATLAIVETMTDTFRSYVQNGGHVIWLAESADSQQTYLGSVEIRPRQGSRWQGDWASNMNWIRQDQMFANIPTSGTVDFAFADLTPEHVIFGLRPRDFAADVHAGLFVGWLHHTVALVAERRFGHGRLMISTFRLSEHLATHPVAAIMLRDMVSRFTEPALRADGERQPRALP